MGGVCPNGCINAMICNDPAIVWPAPGYPPFAKILLVAINLRENHVEPAIVLMKELERDFPGNTLIKKEMDRALDKINRIRKDDKRGHFPQLLRMDVFAGHGRVTLRNWSCA